MRNVIRKMFGMDSEEKEQIVKVEEKEFYESVLLHFTPQGIFVYILEDDDFGITVHGSVTVGEMEVAGTLVYQNGFSSEEEKSTFLNLYSVDDSIKIRIHAVEEE